MTTSDRFLACIIKQYGTGLYRACVSLEKNKTICLSTHEDEASAAETIERFLGAYRQGEIRTAEDVFSFVTAFCGTDSLASSPAIEQNMMKMAA